MSEAESALERLVDTMQHARRTVTMLNDPPRPATLADGYRAQRIAASRWQAPVVGWKVGATSREVQHLFGVEEPLFAPIFADGVVQAPARLPARRFQHRLLEAEFAFRIATDLPPRPEPYRRTEIMDAVAAVIPAIEIISPRTPSFAAYGTPQLVADFVGHGGAILGTPVMAWRGLDLPAHAVRLLIGGELRQAGSGAVVMGDPLRVLEWAANALRAQGLGIAAGQFVMTGTMTGLHAPEPGQPTRADFGSLGAVDVVFE